jgi:hypothetical protein
MRISSLVVFSFLLASGSARAQNEQQLQPRDGAPQRGYVSAGGGATLDSDRSGAFAVEYGDQIGRDVQAYATFSYFDNLITDSTQDDLRRLGDVMAGLTGTAWEFSGRDRGAAFVAGAKFLIPTGSGVRPYVGGGAGAINLKRTITERTRGDLTSAISTGLGFTEGAFNSADASATKPLIEGAFGVSVLAGHTYVDVGYRYRRAFHFARSLEFGQFSVAVGYAF